MREAAHTLFKTRPELLDLSAETIAVWLQSEDEDAVKRLGAVRAADLDTELARAHARTLGKWLTDEDSNVRDATHALFIAKSLCIALSAILRIM